MPEFLDPDLPPSLARKLRRAEVAALEQQVTDATSAKLAAEARIRELELEIERLGSEPASATRSRELRISYSRQELERVESLFGRRRSGLEAEIQDLLRELDAKATEAQKANLIAGGLRETIVELMIDAIRRAFPRRLLQTAALSFALGFLSSFLASWLLSLL